MRKAKRFLHREKALFTMISVLILCLMALFVMSLNPVSVKAADNYDIGVYYFSNWNPELSPHMVENTQTLYGRSDWFGGIKDMLTQPGLWGYGPIAYREPLLGWYDDRQQNTLDQHILQASSRGIDHFAFYYYWDYTGGKERAGQNVNLYNSSPYKDLMKYYLYFVADGVWPQSDWYNLIVPKLLSHVQSSCYKKTADGRPIIGMFGDLKSRFGGTDAGVKAAMNYLRSQCQSAGYGEPLLLYDAWENLSTYTTAQGFDGFLPLNLAGIGLNPGVPGDFTEYTNEWSNFVTRYNGYTMLPGAISSFDARPWRGVSYSADVHPDYVYTNPDPMKFRTMMQQVKSYIDSHPSSRNMATIYAWNELGEGGTIEPSTFFGYGFVNAIQEVFGLDNSAYKAKVQQLGLADLAPNLRVEAMPDSSSVAYGQSFKIKVRTKNYHTSGITSGTISLNSGGWNTTASSDTGLNGLAAGATKDTEFTVTAGSGAAWSKFPMIVNISYTVSGLNLNQSVNTFVVPVSITLLTDSFNSGAVGSSPANWILNTSGGTVTVQAVPSSSDKSMRLQKNCCKYRVCRREQDLHPADLRNSNGGCQCNGNRDG